MARVRCRRTRRLGDIACRGTSRVPGRHAGIGSDDGERSCDNEVVFIPILWIHRSELRSARFRTSGA